MLKLIEKTPFLHCFLAETENKHGLDAFVTCDETACKSI